MSTLFKVAFVYKLFYKNDNKICYIGQTININKRFKEHIKNANNHANLSNRLYFFMNLYDIHNFDIVIIQTLYNVSKHDLNKTEDALIKLFGTLNTLGSNINIVFKIDSHSIILFIDKLKENNYTSDAIDNIIKIINKDTLVTKDNFVTLDTLDTLATSVTSITLDTLVTSDTSLNIVTSYTSNKLVTSDNSDNSVTSDTLHILDAIALKKLRKAERQRIYRANLSSETKAKNNAKVAEINRNRYNTDNTYKETKNETNKLKAKEARAKSKLYLSNNNITLDTNIITNKT